MAWTPRDMAALDDMHPYEDDEPAPVYNRTFNEARKAQGFKSQAHLDAFFAHYDHTHTCTDCHSLDGSVALDDGYQPTVGQCAEATRLYRLYCEVA